jgi:hypothetical protein
MEQQEIDDLITEHNDLLRKVCEQQKRDDAERFTLSYNAETEFFDRDGRIYDARTVRAMIACYKSDLTGIQTGFKCNPNPNQFV